MDFFEHQAQAKAASNRLLLLFLLVCIVFTGLINGILYVFIESFQGGRFNFFRGVSFESFFHWQFSIYGFYASLVSVFMISIGCLSRWFDLRKGGHGLAISLGARSLGFASDQEQEQKLINVVEEMAIAAGVTTPGIYVLKNERAINAFVAGYGFEDSALIVTQGLLDNMNRDELQAVVGHEFSHILHGDNQINIRLLMLLGGIVWVAELGKSLLHGGFQTSGYRRTSSSSNNSKGQIVFIGIPLIIVGYVGVFFGRLIRTAISRKREYLADASSVQFTRNPEALASALNVIKMNAHQGYLLNPRAEGISHMCISASQKSSWFATHPPLEDRINSIDPTFIMRFASREKKQQRNAQREQKNAQQTQAAQSIYNPDVGRLQNQGNAFLHDVIGTLSAANLAYAMNLHDQIPFEYRQALKDPQLAKITLLYILLDNDGALREEQHAWLLSQFPKSEYYLKSLSLLSKTLDAQLALPLVELLIPLLKTLQDNEKKGLIEQVLVLAKWDGKLTLFEICLYSLLKHAFENTEPSRSSHTIKKLDVVAHEVNVIISSLVHSACVFEKDKQPLYNSMMDVFIMKPQALIAFKDLAPKHIYTSLKKLKSLSPMLKRTLMDVCGDIVLKDEVVKSSEYETLKLMSLLLACPMPALPMNQVN